MIRVKLFTNIRVKNQTTKYSDRPDSTCR